MQCFPVSNFKGQTLNDQWIQPYLHFFQLAVKLSSKTNKKMAYFKKIFNWLIVKQIEAFQQSGIQVENGNLEHLLIMWCSHDYNLHQLEFH